ncbi:MAG: hypothetical protein WCS37_05910 [Chloroflexota bacterium]
MRKQLMPYLLLILLLLFAACGETTNTATLSPTISEPDLTSSLTIAVLPSVSPTKTPLQLTNSPTLAPANVSSTPNALPSVTSPLLTPTATSLPTNEPTVTSLPTSGATATSLPTNGATANALPIPFQPIQRQIAPPNCCQAFAFARDGRLYYYDKSATALLDLAGGQSQRLTTRWGLFSPDLSLVAFSARVGGPTTIEQVNDGTRRATLQNRSSLTLISPDNTRLAYLLRSPNQAPEAPQLFELWTGHLDGSNLRATWTLREGANLAWFPDSRHLLLTARNVANNRFGLWVVDSQATTGQSATLIVESKGLLAATLSSDGERVVYAITLQGEVNSGVWLANADGSNRRKFDWVGGWHWSPVNGTELFYSPIRAAGETASALWSYDVAHQQATRLTDPVTLPLRLSFDQWQIAPDNKNMVYRSTTDNALWLVRFR